MMGIRTGVGVNERPVDVQSRALTEAVEAESESPMLHQKKMGIHRMPFFF